LFARRLIRASAINAVAAAAGPRLIAFEHAAKCPSDYGLDLHQKVGEETQRAALRSLSIAAGNGLQRQERNIP
jgi:hypothetical protein